MKVKNLLLLSLILFIFVGCSQPVAKAGTAAESQAPIAAEVSSTPTEQSTPTMIATPETPVSMGTPYPSSSEILDKETVKSVQEVGSVQNGHLLTRMTANLSQVFYAGRSDVTLCDLQVSEDTGTLNACQNVLNHWDVGVRANDDQTLNEYDFDISPDGSHFFLVTDDSLQVYDVEEGLISELPVPDKDYIPEISPDGNFVSLSTNAGTVEVFNVSNGESVFFESGYLSKFTADGKYIAVQKRQAIYFFSTEDWSHIYAFTQDRNSDWAISNNSAVIANFVNRNLVLSSISDGEEIMTIKEFGDDKYGNGELVLSPEGKYAIQVITYHEPYENYSYDYSEYYTTKTLDILEYQVKIIPWNLETGEAIVIEEISSWNAEQEEASEVNIYSSPDDPSYVTFRDYVTDSSNLAIDDSGAIYFLHLERPWKYLSISQKFYNLEDDQILLYSTYTDDPYPHPNEVCLLGESLNLVCYPDNIDGLIEKGLVIDASGNLYNSIHDAYDQYDAILYQTSINPDALATGELFSPFEELNINDEAHVGSYQLKVVNQEKGYFIGHYKYEDRVVDIETGEILNSWTGDISNAVFSPDNNFIAFIYTDPNSSDLQRLGVYDYANNEFKLLDNEHRPSGFMFTEDSSKIFTIFNEDIYDMLISYDMNDLDVERGLHVQFLPGYKIVETEKEDTVRLVKREIDYGSINAIAFSPNEDFILAGTENGYLFAFDLSIMSFMTVELVKEDYILLGLQAYKEDEAILSVAFSNDGKAIYTSSEYGEIKVFANEPYKWSRD